MWPCNLQVEELNQWPVCSAEGLRGQTVPGESVLAVSFSGIQPLRDRQVTSLLTLLQPPLRTQQLLRGFAVWPN